MKETPLQKYQADLIKGLREIGRRESKPDILDRIALPIDRWVTISLARMCEISESTIAESIQEGKNKPHTT